MSHADECQIPYWEIYQECFICYKDVHGSTHLHYNPSQLKCGKRQSYLLMLCERGIPPLWRILRWRHTAPKLPGGPRGCSQCHATLWNYLAQRKGLIVTTGEGSAFRNNEKSDSWVLESLGAGDKRSLQFVRSSENAQHHSRASRSNSERCMNKTIMVPL